MQGDDVDQCRNCGAALTDEYCAACGQRRFRAADRRLASLLAEAVDALTDFDSRLWRSLRASLFRPGRIARDWIDGRRARWVSPVRLFLLANLVFFLLPTLTDLNLPLHNQASRDIYREFAPDICGQTDGAGICGGGQLHSPWTQNLLRNRLLAEREQAVRNGAAFDFRRFEQDYNAHSSEIGKLLVILHAPFMALALMISARPAQRYFVEHFVVAMGMLTFILLLVTLGLHALLFIAQRLPSAWQAAFMAGSFPVMAPLIVIHCVLACRRCYDAPWWKAVLQGLFACLAFAASSLIVFRAVQFLLTLWTM